MGSDLSFLGPSVPKQELRNSDVFSRQCCEHRRVVFAANSIYEPRMFDDEVFN